MIVAEPSTQRTAGGLQKTYVAFLFCFSTMAIHRDTVQKLTACTLLNYLQLDVGCQKPHQLVDHYHHSQWLLHIGGLCETAIKSTNMHLCRNVEKTRMSLSNFNTTIIQVEAILILRPLNAPFAYFNDPSALTLAQYLIGPPLTALPEPPQQDDRTLSSNFKVIKSIVRQF